MGLACSGHCLSELAYTSHEGISPCVSGQVSRLPELPLPCSLRIPPGLSIDSPWASAMGPKVCPGTWTRSENDAVPFPCSLLFPTLAALTLITAPLVGVNSGPVVSTCLPTGLLAGCCIAFPTSCSEEDRNINVLFFGLTISIFQERSGNAPQSLLQTILKASELLLC